MFEVTFIQGELIPYKSKSGEDRTMYQCYVIFPGSPFTFKMTFFRSDQIEKAKSSVASGKGKVKLIPDRNMSPSFELA